MEFSSEHKRFYIAGAVLVAILLIIFLRQIVRTSSIAVTRTEERVVSEATYPISYPRGEPAFGNPGAPVTVAVFGDALTDDSREVVQTVREVVRRNPRALRLVWKDMPKKGLFSDHIVAHEALYCAQKQDRFWDMADEIYARQAVKQEALTTIATNLGLNVEQFTTCLALTETHDTLRLRRQAADDLGISRVPEIFINNKRITLMDGLDLKSMLEEVIAP